MNIKSELIKTFKNLLGVYFEKVYSASELKLSSKELGGKVEIVNADGTLSDAEDGDYVMEDGFAFAVKDGVIDSIVGEDVVEEVPAEEVVEVAAEDVPAEDVPAEDVPVEDVPVEDTTVADLKVKVDELELKLNALIQVIADNKDAEETKMSKANDEFSKQLSELNKSIGIIAKIPVEFSKISTSNIAKDERDIQLMELAKIIGKK